MRGVGVFDVGLGPDASDGSIGALVAGRAPSLQLSLFVRRRILKAGSIFVGDYLFFVVLVFINRFQTKKVEEANRIPFFSLQLSPRRRGKRNQFVRAMSTHCGVGGCSKFGALPLDRAEVM